MRITAEISFYPLSDDYAPAIKGFLDRMAGHPGIRLETNPVSTQLFGEHEAVMNALRDEMGRAFEEYGTAIFVCKFVGRDLDPERFGQGT